VARLLPPESSSLESVSREVGISMATLERWRADALANGAVAGSQRWTAAARLEAVIATAAMDEAARSAWCREQGLYPAELDAWKRDAIAGLGEPRVASAEEARQDRRRVKELERELHRKDKALAETAGLCCQKNSQRSSTTARTHDPPGRPPDPVARHRTSP
jgi:transposase-like protein